jgi:23S rRNA pseudouridine2605 synthase
MMDSQVTERLQKVLARAGLGSRRTIELWIQEGRVKVNQVVATLGQRVGAEDQIEVDGRKLSARVLSPVTQQVICYHKPVGEVCTRDDPEGRPTVFERLPSLAQGRWVSVGRLDINTSGLLLLTTDGTLANRLMHPSYALEREYAVRVLGEVTEDALRNLTKGVLLEDGMARFARVIDAGGQGANHWYHVVLNEGRKREVRRLWEAQGVQVSRLIRIRYGHFVLPKGLREGHHHVLSEAETSALYSSVNLPDPFAPVIAPKTSRVSARSNSHKIAPKTPKLNRFSRKR